MKIKYSKYIQVVHCKTDEHIIYNSRIGNPQSLNNYAYELLVQIVNSKKDIENLKKSEREFIDILIDNGIVILENTNEEVFLNKIINGINKKLTKQAKKGELLENLQLVVTNDCNLNCSYCYLSNQTENLKSGENLKMPVSTAIKIIDNFYCHLENINKKETTLKFFGGEPLMNWDTVKESISHIQKKWANKIETNFIITSNGTLLKDDIAVVLKEHNFSVQISIDGFEDTHDKNRKTLNSQNTFSRVIQSLDILQKHDAFVIVSTVLTKETYNHITFDFIDFLLSKNVKVLDLGLDFLGVFDSSYNEKILLDKIFKLQNYGIDKGLYMSGYFGIPYRNLLNNTKHFCKALGGFVSVEPNGQIFGCKRSNLLLGNIDNIPTISTNSNYLKLVSRTVDSIPQCKGCEIEAGCIGGCFVNHEVENNIIFEPDSNFCNFYKEATRTLLIKNENVSQYEKFDHIFNRKII